MKTALYWIDAFTDRVFQGNPAAVVPLETWPEDRQLQAIARENGLSETAFFTRTAPGRYRLRWFTPAVEVDLCGHATLASGFVLYHLLGEQAPQLEFATRSGPLTVTKTAGGRLELDLPARPAWPAEAPAALVAALGGLAPAETHRSATSWLLVYPESGYVRHLRPDHAALAAFRPGRMIVTAPGGSAGGAAEADAPDFVSRFFAPDAGIAEDPVTGSAHCTLTPYWAARLGRTTLRARQVSARGGELWCTLAGERVKIAGQAVLYLRGEIEV